jgi:tetratricopeptide (TPR) repeat protein
MATGEANDPLVITREIGDRRGEGSTLGNLGTAYAHLGQVERAIGILEQALRIGQEITDPRIIQFTSDLLERLRGNGSAENPENG